MSYDDPSGNPSEKHCLFFIAWLYLEQILWFSFTSNLKYCHYQLYSYVPLPDGFESIHNLAVTVFRQLEYAQINPDMLIIYMFVSKVRVWVFEILPKYALHGQIHSKAITDTQIHREKERGYLKKKENAPAPRCRSQRSYYQPGEEESA